MNDRDIYEQLLQAVRRNNRQEALTNLADYLRTHQRYHELFEALKLSTRNRLGLPLVSGGSEDELPAQTQSALETGLLDACREVGQCLLDQGQLRDAWMYLRPLGDRAAVQRRIRDLEPTDENLDQLIELCLHETLDLERGFRLVLDHYGTCNAITTFENAMYGRPREQRRWGAQMLLTHLHAELTANVRGHVQREGHACPPEPSLSDLIRDQDWLFRDGSYHIDTTHLASVVRFARELDDPDHLKRALELTLYGQRLDPQLQYPGDEPFVDFYPHHERYFCLLLGRDEDRHLEFFRERAEAVDPRQATTAAAETYIDLLARRGRPSLAIDETLRLIPAGVATIGWAPSVLELSQRAGRFGPLKQACREREDLLVYAIALLEEQQADAQTI